MSVLFEIISKRDYCIAKFIVERDYVLCWEEIILATPLQIDLPKDIISIQMEANENNSYYTITVVNDYSSCMIFLELFKRHHKTPFLTPKPFKEEEPFYKELGFETEEEYESYMYLEDCISSEDFDSIGYSHISYESYMSNYE